MSTQPKPSPTAGMNIAQRILHVGGRNNAAGYVEFGSTQAVEALVRQVLRDMPAQTVLPEDWQQRMAASLGHCEQTAQVQAQPEQRIVPEAFDLTEARAIVIDAIRRMRAGHVDCHGLTMQAENFLEATHAAAKSDELWDQTLRERDRYHDVADALAAQIAAITGVAIGEHSSANDPWQNALVAAEEFNQPVELTPVGWRHSNTHTLHESEDDVELADADSWAEPLYTKAQLAALAAQPEVIGTLRRDLARAHDSANDLIVRNKLLQQEVRELKAFRAMVNRYKPEFPSEPDGPRDVWYWQGDHMDHLESMTHTLPVVIRAEQLRELLSAQPVQAQGVPVSPEKLRTALEDLDTTELLGPTTEAAIAAALRWHLAADPQQAEPSTIAGHEAATGLLSALVDEAQQILTDLHQYAIDLQEQTRGGRSERGEVPLMDLAEDWLAARPDLAPTPAPETCGNCDTPAPGCGGLFASDGKACKFHGGEGSKP